MLKIHRITWETDYFEILLSKYLENRLVIQKYMCFFTHPVNNKA